MKKIKYILFTFLLFIAIIPIISAKEVTIHLFYSKTCPHCADEKEFLNEYVNQNKDVKVELYEVTENEENSKLMDDVKKTFNTENNYVPYTVVGEVGLTGYNDSRKEEIIHFVEKYEQEDYIDVVQKVKDNNGPIDLEKKESKEEEKVEKETIKIPIIGEINKKDVSIPLIAIIIGFVDGFNPCAMWVLIFLISMLIGIKDKKRRISLGIIFLLTSGIVYMLFMSAWLKVMVSTMQINIIKILIGIVAIIGAIWNLYSYFKTKDDDVGCEVTNETKRQKMMRKIKKYVSEKSFFIAAIGLMLIAVSVNVIEFVCSAGWPVVFTEILALNNLSPISYFLYILLYIIFYMIDDIIIFIIAMVTLEVTGISNKYNKYSHLIGGILMLLIGLLMIFKPEILMFNF